MSDLFYADKAKRKELSDKSEKIFGVRNRWKTLVNKRGATIEEIEESMDKAINNMEEQLERLRERTKTEGLRKENRGDDTGQRSSIEEAYGKSEEIRKEVRPGETEHGSTTPGGDN